MSDNTQYYLKQIVRECINEILSKSSNISSWDERLNQRAKEATSITIQSGLPLIFGWEYTPQKEANSRQEQAVQNFIWCVKNDNGNYDKRQYSLAKNKAVSFVSDVLVRTFGDKVKDITLVPVPCHSLHSNTSRWKSLVTEICSRCGCTNGFGYFYYDKNNTTIPSHFNKGKSNGQPRGEWDRGFFSQKNVVLLDDLLTTGQSMDRTKGALEKLQSNVVMGIVLAKTKQK